MRFDFPVKHNGVIYEAGKEVPIGKEPKVENQVEDKSASELSKELKEKYGITMAAQKGKKALLEAIAEAEKAKALEAKKEEEPEDGESDEELEEDDLVEDPEGEPGEEDEDENPSEDEFEGEPDEDEETDLLNKIVNE